MSRELASASADAEAEERTETTAGTAPRRRKESFLVRLPMIWFLRSRSALSLAEESHAAELRRNTRRCWAEDAGADVAGIFAGVSSK